MFDSVSVRASFIDTHIRSAPSETFTSVKSFERLINAVEIPVKSTIWDKELQQWPVNQPLPLGAFLLYLVSDSQTLKLQENNAGWRTHLICHGVHNNNKHFVVAEFRSYTKSVFLFSFIAFFATHSASFANKAIQSETSLEDEEKEMLINIFIPSILRKENILLLVITNVAFYPVFVWCH